MNRLEFLGSKLNDQAIAMIASCIDKLEKLEFDAGELTLYGLKVLSIAVNNRPTPVSLQKS